MHSKVYVYSENALGWDRSIPHCRNAENALSRTRKISGFGIKPLRFVMAATHRRQLFPIPCYKKVGGKGNPPAAARPWVVLKLLQSFGGYKLTVTATAWSLPAPRCWPAPARQCRFG
jgi:hypothetical protein